MSEHKFDTWQVCTNGHSITASAKAAPELTAEFCSSCGAKTITACPACSTAIRSCRSRPGVAASQPTELPAYCHQCGQAYPWTAAKLEAVADLLEQAVTLTPDERELLTASLTHIMADTPQTLAAAERWKRAVVKADVSVKASARLLLTDIACEAAKKALFGPGG